MSEKTITENKLSANVLFLNQPAASLVVSKRKSFIVAPYYLLGSFLVVTSFDVLPDHRKIADHPKVKKELQFLNYFAGWNDLPQKAILGHVKITKATRLSKQAVEDWNNNNTFEALVDSFEEGDFLCEIEEACKFKPIPTKTNTIIRDFQRLKLKCHAVSTKL